eukprot:6201701-Pleurochrysis_carterae.AAC.1
MHLRARANGKRCERACACASARACMRSHTCTHKRHNGVACSCYVPGHVAHAHACGGVCGYAGREAKKTRPVGMRVSGKEHGDSAWATTGRQRGQR